MFCHLPACISPPPFPPNGLACEPLATVFGLAEAILISSYEKKSDCRGTKTNNNLCNALLLVLMTGKSQRTLKTHES